jgi:hypothetical protein
VDSVAFRGLTIVRNCSAWTLADSFHPAFHAGNSGSNPVWEAKIFPLSEFRQRA